MTEQPSQPADRGGELLHPTSFDGVRYHDIQKLYQHSVIDELGRDYAERTLVAPLQWERWIIRLCVGLGTALLLLGVVFFFAFNWDDMPAWSKLALLEGTMVVLFVSSVMVGVRRFVGQCLMLSGTIVIGVFFAVFGQIYQTGADAWQLFALWAGLMFGFVWVSQFSIQWLVQWSITGLAFTLFLHQYTRIDNSMLATAYTALYCWGVWGLTMALAKHWAWLNIQWLKSLISAVALMATIFVVLSDIFDNSLISVVPVLAFITIVMLILKLMKKELLTQVLAAASLAINIWIIICYFCVYGLFNNQDGIIVKVGVMLMVTIVLSVGLYHGVVKLKRDFERVTQHTGDTNGK